MKLRLSIVLALTGTLYLTPLAMSQTLGDVARQARAKRAEDPNPTQGPVFQGQEQRQGQAPGQPDGAVRGNESQYRKTILDLLARRDFAGLEEAANAARTSRDRIEGGAWKLFIFYEVMANHPLSDRAGTVELDTQVRLLEDWVKARPESITARVALAEAYRTVGWNARGSGFANTVTDASWDKFDAQDAKAAQTLLDAQNLSAKCPHWYYVMLEIARDQGLGKAETRSLFESAIAFEPTYYHYYREYALNLLPKWHGYPGEAEALAEDSNNRIGGPQGAFVYFQIATILYCMCYDKPVTPTLSWTTLQEGFKEIDEHYGATTLVLNRFALLAYLYQDRAVARKVFARLGDQWEPELWRKHDTFNTARTWAGVFIQ
jgi:hypothetical protein